MRFVDVKRFSPIIYLNDLPHSDDLFHIKPSIIPTQLEDRKKFKKENNIFKDVSWWQKQIQRCISGYTVENAIEPGGDAIEDGVDAFWRGNDCYIPQYDLLIKDRKVHISGRYYFFLNFWNLYGIIDGTKRKGIVKPRFLDHQFLLSRRWEMMEEQEKDEQEMKTRQLGYSEIYAGGVLSYNYTFFPASVNIIVAGQQKDSDHTFANCDRGLKLLINTELYQERARGGDNKQLIKSKHTESEIWALTAKDDPQTLSGMAPTVVYFEEIGKGKRGWSLDVAGFVESSIKTNDMKTGFCHFIGTSGNLDEGAYDLEQRVYNPEKYNILSFKNVYEPKGENVGNKRVGHFVPKWWFKIIDEDGNTQKEAGIKLLLEERKKKDIKDLYIHITQEAIYLSEALQMSTLGFFGENKISSLNRRRIEIKQNTEFQIERRGILRLKEGKKELTQENLEFIPDDRGWLNIIEEPCKDKNGKVWLNLYRAGTDTYNQDVAHYSDSKGAMYVKKKMCNDVPDMPLTKTYVAELIERPSANDGGLELFYQHTIMICVWYRCMNNIEYVDNRIFEFYTKNGFEHLLYQRPRLAFANKILRSVLNNPYGTDKTLKPHGLSILSDRLTDEFIGNMYFMRQIEALAKFKYSKDYNCDITIATMECEIADNEDEMLIVRSESDIVNKRRKRVFRNIGGRITATFA